MSSFLSVALELLQERHDVPYDVSLFVLDLLPFVLFSLKSNQQLCLFLRIRFCLADVVFLLPTQDLRDLFFVLLYRGAGFELFIDDAIDCLVAALQSLEAVINIRLKDLVGLPELLGFFGFGLAQR